MTEMSDTPEFLTELNRQQRTAVQHGESPLLIIAGAGTGKTTTLAHRVAWHVVRGIEPSRILLLTFTRRAATEMLRRVESILRNLDSDSLSDPSIAERARIRRIHGGTFHAVATNLLRRHGHILGLHPDFTILDRSDSEDLLNVARTQLNLPKSENRFPLKSTCLDIYSRCVNTQTQLDTVLTRWFPWCAEHLDVLGKLFSLYAERKEDQRVLDFDDLLLFWNALAEDDTGQKMLRDKFDCVLVDEYQDTNILQAQILKNIVPDGRGLTAVGDDAQSIYSFRAATVRNILDFPTDYPGTTVVPLEQNYRSTSGILSVTNRVIGEAAERHHKELWSDRNDGVPPKVVTCGDEDDQSEYVIDTVMNNREAGVLLKNQAVLFRASHHSMALESELGRRHIPFQKYGGLRFLETAHVKDLIAFLRLAENPLDLVAGTRVLMLLPGIGQAKATLLLETLHAADGRFTAWDSWKPPAATSDIWNRFTALLKTITAAKADSVSELSAHLHAVRTFYTPLLESKYDNAKARGHDLKQLEIISARYRSRAEFLTEMTLDPPASTQDLAADPQLDEDYLILSTIHSAKGLEWDSVFVIHAADGNIPADMATGSDDEIEEERRLFYVAMTRARNSLHICRPERYYFHHKRRSDTGSLSRISRFLSDATLQLCEVVSVGIALGDDSHQRGSGLVQQDTTEVRKKISRLWGN